MRKRSICFLIIASLCNIALNDLRTEGRPSHYGQETPHCIFCTRYLEYSTKTINPPISSPVWPGFIKCERIWQWKG